MAKLGIDVSKAREIQKDIMRTVRKPLLDAEDIVFMKAVEANDADAKAASVARKQALRDCTNCVDTHEVTSTSLLGVTEQLKQCWDDCLGANPAANGDFS